MLRNRNKFRIEQIVAFGDDVNDIKMLEGCGVGVAVSNALPTLYNVAAQICGSNKNDGVAHWIEYNVL